MDSMPSDPGNYCYDPDLGWIRFDDYAAMLLYRLNSEPPMMVRVVTDPSERLI